jgi:hypothetical protein
MSLQFFFGTGGDFVLPAFWLLEDLLMLEGLTLLILRLGSNLLSRDANSQGVL